jgi:hypothetical protein
MTIRIYRYKNLILTGLLLDKCAKFSTWKHFQGSKIARSKVIKQPVNGTPSRVPMLKRDVLVMEINLEVSGSLANSSRRSNLDKSIRPPYTLVPLLRPTNIFASTEFKTSIRRCFGGLIALSLAFASARALVDWSYCDVTLANWLVTSCKDLSWIVAWRSESFCCMRASWCAALASKTQSPPATNDKRMPQNANPLSEDSLFLSHVINKTIAAIMSIAPA